MPIAMIHDIPLECINHAALLYHVPATVIISVLETEGGKIGSASRNKNKTYDYGPMQINSSWLGTLSKYGYTQKDIQYDPCINVKVGTWILAQGITEGKDVLNGIGNYNSHTKELNNKYSSIVYKYYKKIMSILGQK